MRKTAAFWMSIALAATLTGCGAPAGNAASVTPASAGTDDYEAQARRVRPINEVKGFVYHWFSLFDRNAPVEEFLPKLDKTGLEMRFPEATLNGVGEFQNWYGGILCTIARANHDVRTVEVTPQGQGRWSVHVIVLWTATTTEGQPVQFLADQTWAVREIGGRLVISQYLVSAAQ